jgi:hypothetical protein
MIKHIEFCIQGAHGLVPYKYAYGDRDENGEVVGIRVNMVMRDSYVLHGVTITFLKDDVIYEVCHPQVIMDFYLTEKND